MRLPPDSKEIKEHGRGKWSFRGYYVEAQSREEAAAKLDLHYQEAQEMDSRLRKRRKLTQVQRLATQSAPLQPQAVQELRHPRKDITEVFKGQMRETDVEVSFTEEHTWFRMAVQRATLRHS